MISANDWRNSLGFRNCSLWDWWFERISSAVFLYRLDFWRIVGISQRHENLSIVNIVWIGQRKRGDQVPSCHNLSLHFFDLSNSKTWEFFLNNFYNWQERLLIIIRWWHNFTRTSQRYLSLCYWWLHNRSAPPFISYGSRPIKRFVNLYCKFFWIWAGKIKQEIHTSHNLVLSSL